MIIVKNQSGEIGEIELIGTVERLEDNKYQIAGITIHNDIGTLGIYSTEVQADTVHEELQQHIEKLMVLKNFGSTARLLGFAIQFDDFKFIYTMPQDGEVNA